MLPASQLKEKVGDTKDAVPLEENKVELKD